MSQRCWHSSEEEMRVWKEEVVGMERRAFKTYLGFKIGRTWWALNVKSEGEKGVEDDWQNFGWISNTEKIWEGWEKLNVAWGAYETFGKIFQESSWINNCSTLLAGWLTLGWWGWENQGWRSICFTFKFLGQGKGKFILVVKKKWVPREAEVWSMYWGNSR